MSTRIRTVGVLGAGTMGAQIAAHFANAGVPVLLLDVTRDAAREGLARARKLKPDPFFTSRRSHARPNRRLRRGPARYRHVRLDHRSRRRTARRQAGALRARRPPSRAARHRQLQHIGHSDRGDRRRPVRRPSGRTPSARISSIRRAICGWSRSSAPPTPTRRSRRPWSSSADHRLGKGVVAAKDTPNFIANRIGLYGVMQILRAWTDPYVSGAPTRISIGDRRHHRPGDRPSEERDVSDDGSRRHRRAGPRRRGIWPDSLDRDDDRGVFALPPVVDDLVERGWVGAKSGQGFYKKDASGEILTLDPASMTYRPGAPARLPSLDAAKAIEDPGARIKALFGGKDKVGRVPARDAGAHARLRRAGRARGRLFHRRRGPRDAVGLWLGAGAVRDLGCDRHRARARGVRRQRPAARRPRRAGARRVPRASATANATSAWRPPEPGCSCCARRRSEPPSCGGTPAPA